MGRYFWLRLQDNFFESADIKVVLSQENGPAYVCFWLRLLLLALKQEDPGRLRFKPEIPYDEKLLSTVLDTNIDFVRSALKLFSALGMIQKVEDGTLEIDALAGMIGSENASAERVRRFRERQKLKALPCNVTGNKIGNEVEKSRVKKTRQNPSAKQRGDVSGGKAAEYPAGFEIWWTAYPRKTEKRAAFAKYRATLKKGGSEADLLTAVNAYAAACAADGREPKYIKHPATFLGPAEPWREYLVSDGQPVEESAEQATAALFGR
jgi:predicted phage replisome organizer